MSCEYYAEQHDDGFWYVRRAEEKDRPETQRDWVMVAAGDEPDGGEAAAHIAAQALWEACYGADA